MLDDNFRFRVFFQNNFLIGFHLTNDYSPSSSVRGLARLASSNGGNEN